VNVYRAFDNGVPNRVDILGLLTWTGYSEQNCNPGAWGFAEDWPWTIGYWHEPDNPPQVRNWNMAYADFGHRCGSWILGGMCNSQTLLEITAKNDDCCCSRWTITCEWAYRAEVHSTGGFSQIDLKEVKFLGNIPYPFYASLFTRDPWPSGVAPGHNTVFMNVVDSKTTSTPVTIPCGQEIQVFYMRPQVTWSGFPDIMKEVGWAKCTEQCEDH
jgi:hypothetical protein